MQTEVHGICPEHGIPLRYRDLEQQEMYCPLDEGPQDKRAAVIQRLFKPGRTVRMQGKYKFTSSLRHSTRPAHMSTKRAAMMESPGHERAEARAITQLLRAEQAERKAQRQKDPGAWRKAENKEHGAIRQLVRLEKKEHPGEKFSAMRDELSKISAQKTRQPTIPEHLRQIAGNAARGAMWLGGLRAVGGELLGHPLQYTLSRIPIYAARGALLSGGLRAVSPVDIKEQVKQRIKKSAADKLALGPARIMKGVYRGLVGRGVPATAAATQARGISFYARTKQRPRALKELKLTRQITPKLKTAAMLDELQKLARLLPLVRLQSRVIGRQIGQLKSKGLLRKGQPNVREQMAEKARGMRSGAQFMAGQPKQKRIGYMKTPEGREGIQRFRGQLGMKPVKFPKSSSAEKFALGPLALFAAGMGMRSLAGGFARKGLTALAKKAPGAVGRGAKKTLGFVKKPGARRFLRRGGTAAELGSIFMPTKPTEPQTGSY